MTVVGIENERLQRKYAEIKRKLHEEDVGLKYKLRHQLRDIVDLMPDDKLSALARIMIQFLADNSFLPGQPPPEDT